MLALFVLGLALTVGLVLLVRGLVNANPKALARAVTVVGAGLAALAMIALILTRRIDLIVAALSLLLPIAAHWRRLWQRMKAETGPSPGRTSEVTTAHLRMSLDHDSGQMQGRVIAGRFQNQDLSDLDETSLFSLLSEYRQRDRKSASLLETWLDRMYDAHWRTRFDDGTTGSHGPDADRTEDRGRQRSAASEGPMSRTYALSILGLEEGATPAQIREAHRRLMVRLHPDHGGTSALAAQINQARDLLLKR